MWMQSKCRPYRGNCSWKYCTAAHGSGDIKSIEEAREIIKRSQDIKIYEPQDKEAWDEAYERFKKILV